MASFKHALTFLFVFLALSYASNPSMSGGKKIYTRAVMATANATTGTLTSGKLTSTTGDATITTVTANVTATISCQGDPSQVDKVDLTLFIQAQYKLGAGQVTITIIITNNGTSNGTSKRAIETVLAAPVNVGYIIVINIFFPNESAIAAITGGGSTSPNITAQLSALEKNLTALCNNSAAFKAAAGNITIIGVSVSSKAVVTTTPITTGGRSPASALLPTGPFAMFLAALVALVFAESFSLFVPSSRPLVRSA